MDVLYPNLHDRFKSEGVCPICLMEMELAPRYSCTNEHTVCHRCKPYYYACPTCRSPLELEIPPGQVSPPYPLPTSHFLPHPMPPQFPGSNPSAPPMNDFLAHERQFAGPPMPQPNQELIPCSYSHLGCWVKIPEYLQELHESRCQFRPHLEEEHLPTDLNHCQDDLVPCTYQSVGCNVKTSPWRRSIHEKYCIYKDRMPGGCNAVSEISDDFSSVSISDDFHGDPEELVECRFRRYGCMVNMPRRRKSIHEQKCNYQKYHSEDEIEEVVTYSSEEDFDPDEQVDCRWAEYGCRVRPKRLRKEIHEEKCNYRMEECAYKYNGCDAMFQPSRRYAHEKSCGYAD